MNAKPTRRAAKPRSASREYSARELQKLRALEKDIHAGRVSDSDGSSLEELMDRAMVKAARALRSRA
jgi:hypothetical protein